MQISLIKPLLEAHGVGLVAVGLEQVGVEEFIERKFFDGGIHLLQQCYKYPTNDILLLTQMYILMKSNSAIKIWSTGGSYSQNYINKGGESGGFTIIIKISVTWFCTSICGSSKGSYQKFEGLEPLPSYICTLDQ